MENIQKFIPEGWNCEKQEYSLEELRNAQIHGLVMQGFVEECDENYGLHINLGNDIIGVIPRHEMDALNCDEFGMTRQSICKNKVNQFVQFKVKEVYDDKKLLLSRKEVRKRCFKLGEKRLASWNDCGRNCQKYAQIWGFCGHRRRHYRLSAY